MRRIKLFGLRIWISREPLKVKNRKNHSKHRNRQRNLRLEMVENRCEVCGKPITKTCCHLFHALPVGEPDRNAVENIRVLCGECWHDLEKRPHIHGYRGMTLDKEAQDRAWVLLQNRFNDMTMKTNINGIII